MTTLAADTARSYDLGDHNDIPLIAIIGLISSKFYSKVQALSFLAGAKLSAQVSVFIFSLW